MVTPFVNWVEGREGRPDKKALIPPFCSCLPFLTEQPDAQDISMVTCEERHGSRGRGQKRK